MLIHKIQLESDETILLMVRKHWFVITMQMFAVIAIAFFPGVAWFSLSFVPFFTPVLAAVNTGSTVALYTAWLIVCWMALFSVWTNYYLDVWTVTTKRLITVDQRGLFNRLTGSFRLERLQDVEVSVRGILATFLDYGDLEAETASEDQHFVARNIPHPQEVKALILKTSDTVTFNPLNSAPSAAAPTHVNDGL